MKEYCGVTYLIVCHEDPIHLKKLINALDGEENLFFIHVDKKSDINLFKNEIDNDKVSFINKRVKTYWGGFSLVQVLTNLLEEALKVKNQRYVYISGLDYPIWSNQRMQEFYAKNTDKQLIRAYNISNSNDNLMKKKISRCGYWDIPIRNERLFNKVRTVVNYLLGKIPHPLQIIVNNDKMDIYYGSQWWSLTYDCVKYVYDFYKNNKEIKRYFKLVGIPDEMVVQTILANSKYRDSIELTENHQFENMAALHYLEYKGKMKVFRENDFDVLISSEKMFVRKLKTGESDELYRMIDCYRSAD